MTGRQLLRIAVGSALALAVVGEALRHYFPNPPKPLGEARDPVKGGDDAIVRNALEHAKRATAVRDTQHTVDGSLSIKDISWKRGGFGSVAIVSFTIVNANDFPIKDFGLTCAFYGNSKTTLDTKVNVIYEIVPAKGTKRIRDFDLGLMHNQAARAACEPRGFKRA